MIAEELRRTVRELYDFRCGYCGVRESDAGASLTLDHFHPRSRGGDDSLDNLVYCCHACNEFKSDYWQPESERRILHPRRDVTAEHVVQSENGLLRALTPTGEFHIMRLRLNRGALVAHRREQKAIARDREDKQALVSRVEQLEKRIESLQTQAAVVIQEPENHYPS